MPIYKGTTNQTPIYFGNKEVLKVYLGNILKYQKPITNIGGYGLLYNWYVTQPQVSQSSLVEYGALYNWYAAADARNIANTGWHIPSKTECETLITYLGGSSVAAAHLKMTGTTDWISEYPGTDNSSGFNGRGSGYRNSSNGVYDALKHTLDIRTSTNNGSDIWFFNFGYGGSGTSLAFGSPKYGFSIRLLKDATTLTHGQTGTYVGNDGKIYPTICIGTQEWLSCNLNETKYHNGDWVNGFNNGIYTPISNNGWSALTTEAMCYYNDVEDTGGVTTSLTSSDDWVVPTQVLWEDLFNSLDTYDGIGGWPILGTKLREIGFAHWLTQKEQEGDIEYGIEGTNDYGFNLRGPGARDNNGTFNRLGEFIQLMSTSPDILEIEGAHYQVFTSFQINEISQSNYMDTGGTSIRLCNPSTLLTEGQTGTYTQNDGTILNTIVINGVEWLSENLVETKYRNGDWIPGFDNGVYTPIDNTTWGALTTGALCAYNDDWNNV